MDSRLYTLTALPEKQSHSLLSMGHFCNPKFFFDYAAGFSLSGTSGKFLAGDWQFVVSAWLHQSVSEEGRTVPPHLIFDGTPADSVGDFIHGGRN